MNLHVYRETDTAYILSDTQKLSVTVFTQYLALCLSFFIDWT